ncbi:MAG: hypothetical protein J07HR59_01160 [Halorubrum sp. J07HR59]|nr:MAG: hypothetical protein J07HR59_01160 [Halorubrum sp. J07HR59]
MPAPTRTSSQQIESSLTRHRASRRTLGCGLVEGCSRVNGHSRSQIDEYTGPLDLQARDIGHVSVWWLEILTLFFSMDELLSGEDVTDTGGDDEQLPPQSPL